MGLETIIHQAPSTIGIDTLERSNSNIPKVFLRKSGISDNILEHIQFSYNKSIEYYTCFISYSRQNQDFVKILYEDLQNNGVRCWYAPVDLKIGDKYWHRIDENIRLYDKLLIILSEYSVESEWVEREIMVALEKESQYRRTVLFPIRLDDSIFKFTSTSPWASMMRRERHIGNFTRWKHHDYYQTALDRLLRDLQTSIPGSSLRNHPSL
jgi:hypothetical protein